MKRYNKMLRFFLSAVILAAAVAGCVDDNIEAPVLSGKTTAITLRIPMYELPATRSIEGAKGEAVVKSIDLMIFDKTSPKPKLLCTFNPGSSIRQSADGPFYIVSFSAGIELFENAGTLAVVANAHESVDQAINGNGAPPEGRTDKEEIMTLLQYTQTADGDGTYKWNVSEDNYTPIPMYGEVALPGALSPGTTLTDIRLTRMLARIDLQNLVEAATFDLQNIYLVNYTDRGRIAPNWNLGTGAVYKPGESGYIYETNIDPTLPAGVAYPDAPMKYAYNQPATGQGPLLAGQIYTFETLADYQAESKENRISLILEGLYKGTPYYYRVDFTCSADIIRGDHTYASKGDYLPLYRNHKYVVTITAAEGIGYTTFDEALKADGVLSNLRTNILTVNMDGITDIVYDGQYFMGVEQRGYLIYWKDGPQLNVKVNTDYPGAWSATVLDNPSWLQLGSTSGPVTNKTFHISVTLTPSPSSSRARIVYKAGRLQDTITIDRYSITDMFARSNIVLDENDAPTFATDNNDAIPAYSQGLFFKWGSLIGLSPAANPFTSAEVVYNPTSLPSGGWGGNLEGWDRIPYAHSKFGFPGQYPSGDGHDAFNAANYNEDGYDAVAGIGDICRYLSVQNGLKDKWRMPTLKEYELLYDETTPPTSGTLTFANTTATLNASASLYTRGNFNPGSGWWYGYAVNASTPSTSNMEKPPVGTIFLPTGGHRDPNLDGEVVHVGAYGYYWTATPYDNITVNYPFLSKWGLDYYDADRSYAFPVRCIKDY